MKEKELEKNRVGIGGEGDREIGKGGQGEHPLGD